MRFHLGAIPESPDFEIGAAWSPLREPTPWMFQFLALPISVLNLGAFALMWVCLTPSAATFHDVAPLPFIVGTAAIVVTQVVLHEGAHLLAHPGAGTTRQSIAGLWPSRLLFFAHYDGELTRNRFVVILAAPIVTLSVIPLIVAAIFHVSSPPVAALSIINAGGSCGDLLGIWIVLRQVPAVAIVRNQGWATYWRKTSPVTLPARA